MAQIIQDLAQEGNPFSEGVNQRLERMADELGAGYESDPGQDSLMEDLAYLIDEAFHFQFHDFKNKKYATPKVELRSRLLQLAKNVEDGKYDN